MKRRVLISCRQLQNRIDDYRDLFAKHDIEIEVPPVTQHMSEAELLKIIDRFDGVIAGDDEFTANVLQKGKCLKTVIRWGIGMDSVDLEAAQRLGIRVDNTPGMFADEVADVVMGYIILLARQLHKLDRGVRSGEWTKIQGMSLRGKVLGVIGVGSIGSAVAQRGAAAGMSILGYDVVPRPGSHLEQSGIQLVTLPELLKNADFISLNCNLTKENRHMLGPDQFATMKQGVHIINTARGPLIDENALVAALRAGKVAGAALDVFEHEPLPADSPLQQFDNCIFGTHNSSNTLEGVLRVNELAVQKLLAALDIHHE